MRVELQPGMYIVAVSGGVDSVVLLDLLVRQSDLSLVVAHFDHGIRPDSADDAEFVRQLAASHGLQFETERAELGAGASEADARRARYDFLKRVQAQHEAQAIVTAHHQDDLLETAIFNLLRGTGRLGLTSLKSTLQLQRPLLDQPKSAIQAYALKQNLSWREDTTNHDERYARNYIRHRLLVQFNADARQQLLALIVRQQSLNTEIDQLLAALLPSQGTGLDRKLLTNLSHDVAKEYLAAWLRQQGIADFDRVSLERLVVNAKTKPIGKRFDVLHGKQLAISEQTLVLV